MIVLEWLESVNYVHWLGFGMLLLIAEMMGAGGYLIWTGLAGVFVALLAVLFPSMGWQWQVVIFVLSSVVLGYFWWRHSRQSSYVSDKPHLNDRTAEFVGRKFPLSSAIEQGQGKISVDDSYWNVVGSDLPKGTLVVVVSAVDSLTLSVEEFKDT